MLIVVRHGRTPANAAGQLLGRRDPELDELGRVQAAAVGIAISTAARVISSPLMRCRQTAEAISTSVEIDERRDVVSLLLQDGALRRDGVESTIGVEGFRMLLPGLTPKQARDAMLGMVVAR